jgi:uncharacterized protein (DUF362 family)/Pyruvate/2-oxoacid:ferredoxin oxidoreductase delta subunit
MIKENIKDREILFEECDNYKEGVEKAKEILKDSRFYKGLNKKDKILLKPNMLAPREKERNITTHPSIVEGIIEGLVEKVSKDNIYLSDSPGNSSAKRVAKVCGIKEICDRYGIKIISIEKQGKFKAESGRDIPLFADFKDYKVINLPKAKTHVLTALTCAVKNLYGLVPGRIKAFYHAKYPHPENFSKLLLDIAEVVQPDFTLVDGIVGMEGDGPSNGKTKKAGFILAGQDVLDVDYLVSRAVGIDPKKVPYLRLSIEEGKISIKELERLSKEAGFPLVRFKLPKTTTWLFHTLFNLGLMQSIRNRFGSRPVVINDKCIGCGICARACPAKAITIKKGKAWIDRKKCVRCFCCAELCPEDSIKIKRGL